MVPQIDEKENLEKMRRGDLYYAFTPQLAAQRQKCSRVLNQINKGDDLTRRQMAEFWKEFVLSPLHDQIHTD